MTNDSAALRPPFVVAALLCDEVLEEKDGRLSLIRLVTEVAVEAAGQDPPTEMPVANIPIRGLLSLNAGGVIGTYTVTMKLIDPAGGERLAPHREVKFLHGAATANLLLRFTLTARVAGLYWIAPMVNGRELTRLPLTIRYVRRTTGDTPAHAPAQDEGDKPS